MNFHDVEEELKKYVSLDRFTPVERLVYGFVAIMLTAVVAAIMTWIIRKP